MSWWIDGEVSFDATSCMGRIGTMACRQGSEAERIARERIKTRHDVEVAAVGDFSGRELRIEQLRAEIEALNAKHWAAPATSAETWVVSLTLCDRPGSVLALG